MTLSVLAHKDTRVRFVYGPVEQTRSRRTEPIKLRAGEPHEVVLEGLLPNAAYNYTLKYAESEKPLFAEEPSGSFHTARSAGTPFTFTIQADSHLDEGCLPELYQQTLANVNADQPDFHVDLGDTFMTGKHVSRESALLQYAAQRYCLGMVGRVAPVFFVIGNHDGEETKRPGAAAADGLAAWSCRQRKRVLPNPAPGGFYSGNATVHPHAGLLQNYYAWTWGDALFVVLDPYWTSRSTRGGREPWGMTLGKEQYDWLCRALRTSRAKYKFVFIHQLVGGLDPSGRGGAEAARLFEWGGHEFDGQRTFAEHRPGWDKPIHELLVETGVNIVFHGHDHFFARQECDGIVYQLVPQPAHRNFKKHFADEYGYKTGDFLPSSGHLRIRVHPDRTSVEYVCSATPDMTRRGLRNGKVAFRYAIR
ncbi:MAG: metallophosphoesterase [Planctomycetes bacterium]|nr:metallophosphoesterase [Planctomycetota bacterium]